MLAYALSGNAPPKYQLTFINRSVPDPTSANGFKTRTQTQLFFVPAILYMERSDGVGEYVWVNVQADLNALLDPEQGTLTMETRRNQFGSCVLAGTSRLDGIIQIRIDLSQFDAMLEQGEAVIGADFDSRSDRVAISSPNFADTARIRLRQVDDADADVIEISTDTNGGNANACGPATRRTSSAVVATFEDDGDESSLEFEEVVPHPATEAKSLVARICADDGGACIFSGDSEFGIQAKFSADIDRVSPEIVVSDHSVGEVLGQSYIAGFNFSDDKIGTLEASGIAKVAVSLGREFALFFPFQTVPPNIAVGVEGFTAFDSDGAANNYISLSTDEVPGGANLIFSGYAAEDWAANFRTTLTLPGPPDPSIVRAFRLEQTGQRYCGEVATDLDNFFVDFVVDNDSFSNAFWGCDS